MRKLTRLSVPRAVPAGNRVQYPLTLTLPDQCEASSPGSAGSSEELPGSTQDKSWKDALGSAVTAFTDKPYSQSYTKINISCIYYCSSQMMLYELGYKTYSFQCRAVRSSNWMHNQWMILWCDQNNILKLVKLVPWSDLKLCPGFIISINWQW